MKGYRTRLQISLISAASVAVFGCTTTGSPSGGATSPQPTPTAPPASAAGAAAQPVATPSPSLAPIVYTPMPSDAMAMPYGLRYVDLKVGTGVTPKAGQTCTVHYTGWLKENGKKFDSSYDRGQPHVFQIFSGKVIRGWDDGISTMQVGGKRKLEIPPLLAYGESGANGVIPSNATLIFDVELLDVK